MRTRRQREFRREREWQVCHPYYPPLRQCIEADRLLFKSGSAEEDPRHVDFKSGNFGTEFDKVRRMRIQAAEQANSLWRASDRGDRKWSPAGERIGVDGEVVLEPSGTRSSKSQGTQKACGGREGAILCGTKKEDAMMLRRAKMSMRQVHGNFRPSSATRRVRGAWGNKALDLEGLSQSSLRTAWRLGASALVDEARVVEKNVKNLQFQSRVVNERGPGRGDCESTWTTWTWLQPRAVPLSARRKRANR